MSDRIVKTVGIVGTGVIGASWAALFLARGLDVRATDPGDGAEARLRAAIAQHWPVLQSMGLGADASPDRLVFDANPDTAMPGVDFVQESGPERIDVKIETFRQLDALLPADVILSSSTSGLQISDVQVACRHPERVVLGHPFNPPHLVPLVEVMGGRTTAPEAVDRAMAFYRSVGKRPIRLRKEMKGHVANRLQAALWREAFHLVGEGAATVADIDAAIAHGPGLRWALLGVFRNIDLSGADAGIAHVLAHLGPGMEEWWHDLGTPDMTPDLVAKVVGQTADAAEGRSATDLAAARDAALLALLDLKAHSTLPE